MRLIEFVGVESDNPTARDYEVLNNIYNPIPGEMFCSSATSRVSYHKTSPELNDEIKIRLPLTVNRNHHILFRVFHIHVKIERRGSIFGGKKADDSGEIYSLIGQGYLPLLSPWGCLLGDSDYAMQLFEDNGADEILSPSSHLSISSMDSQSNSEPVSIGSTRPGSSQRRSTSSSIKYAAPTIVVRTRAFSSFMSTNKDLQYFLSNHPPPLGHLPSLTADLRSILPPFVAPGKRTMSMAPSFMSMTSSVDPTGAPSNTAESLLLDSTMFFVHLSFRMSVKKGDSPGGSVSTASDVNPRGIADDVAKIELSRHFFGIMRQLVRVLCGGDCSCKPKYANPYCHSDLRCASFLALFRVFDVVAPHVQTGESNWEGELVDAEYLRSYVEFVFDEEVYAPPPPQRETPTHTGTVISAKALLKTRRSLDLHKKQHSSELTPDEALDIMVDHAMAQVEEIVYQGSLLSAIGKVSSEILNGRLQSVETQDSRWWQGYVNEKTILEELETSLSTGMFTPKSSTSVDAVNPLKEPLVVQPILPRYDSVEGFIQRRYQLKEQLRDLDVNSQTPSIQWWPWLYEVIVYQWSAFLNVFDPRKRERLQASSVVIEEEDEEENGDDDQWSTNIPYPFRSDNPIFRESKMVESLRSLATKHGPILLATIMKSLSLRIIRDHKNAPVIMDEEFIVALENLMSSLAREVHTRGKSMLPCRRLNMAISHFLRDLFALVVPMQVARVVHAYFISSRKIQRENQEISQKPQVDQVKTRINFIHELARLDHFFAVNFPLHIGQQYASYVLSPIFSTKELQQRVSGTMIRGIKNPPHHWLSHLIVNEIMTDYISNEKNLREGSMRMLRDLLVRLSYNADLQSGESRHRTCAMFLPLIVLIVDLVDHFKELAVDCVERKEALAIVVHVLQDTPEFLQREIWRRMCVPRTGQHRKLPTLTSDSPRGVPPSDNFSTQTKQKLPIHNAVVLFNLILDTFELPLSEGGLKGDVSALLSPGVVVDDVESADMNTEGGLTAGRQKSSSVTRNRVGNTADALSQLEARHNMKSKAVPVAGRGRLGKGEERNWKKSIKQAATLKNQTGVGVSLMRSVAAAKHVNHTSTMCMIKVISAMLEECPRLLHLSRSKYRDTVYNESHEVFMSNVLNLLLHTLNTKQSEIAVCNAFRVSETVLKQFGSVSFIHFAGDTFQYWIRSTLTACASLFAALRFSATRFLFSFLQSSFQWTGSLTSVTTPLIAVLRDVVDNLRSRCKDKPSMIADDYYLEPLFFSVGVMKENAASGKTKLINATSSILNFLNNVEVLIKVYAFISGKLPFTVPYHWNGANNLDSMSFSNTQLVKSTDSFQNVDVDLIIALFIKGAESIDVLQLPRIKMYILENLSKIHDIIGNPAESAMVRWEIQDICSRVKDKCTTLWAPKPPLRWATSRTSSPSSSHPHFCAALLSAKNSPIAHPWQSASQHRRHTITALTVAAEKFKDCHLVYLAERALLTLMGMYRAEADNVALLSECYSKMANMFTVASAGNMKFAMGTFYRVLYIGGGTSFQLWHPYFRQFKS